MARSACHFEVLIWECTIGSISVTISVLLAVTDFWGFDDTQNKSTHPNTHTHQWSRTMGNIYVCQLYTLNVNSFCVQIILQLDIVLFHRSLNLFGSLHILFIMMHIATQYESQTKWMQIRYCGDIVLKRYNFQEMAKVRIKANILPLERCWFLASWKFCHFSSHLTSFIVAVAIECAWILLRQRS